MEDDEGEKERREGGGLHGAAVAAAKLAINSSRAEVGFGERHSRLLSLPSSSAAPPRRNRLHLSSGTSSIRVITLITIAIVGS